MFFKLTNLKVLAVHITALISFQNSIYQLLSSYENTIKVPEPYKNITSGTSSACEVLLFGIGQATLKMCSQITLSKLNIMLKTHFLFAELTGHKYFVLMNLFLFKFDLLQTCYATGRARFIEYENWYSLKT